jgi:hypothetical protein
VRLKLKYCLLTLVLAGLVFGQNLIVPTTLADITGDGAVHAIAAGGSARWIVFVALSTNVSTVRLGDSNITTTRGVPVPPGQSFSILESTSTFRHSLSGWNYLIQSGDKLSITYGQ